MLTWKKTSFSHLPSILSRKIIIRKNRTCIKYLDQHRYILFDPVTIKCSQQLDSNKTIPSHYALNDIKENYFHIKPNCYNKIDTKNNLVPPSTTKVYWMKTNLVLRSQFNKLHKMFHYSISCRERPLKRINYWRKMQLTCETFY